MKLPGNVDGKLVGEEGWETFSVWKWSRHGCYYVNWSPMMDKVRSENDLIGVYGWYVKKFGEEGLVNGPGWEFTLKRV